MKKSSHVRRGLLWASAGLLLGIAGLWFFRLESSRRIPPLSPAETSPATAAALPPAFRGARPESAPETPAAARAERPRRSRPSVVSDEWVVTLRAGADIDAIAARYGATVAGRLDRLGAYRLRFADARRAAEARALMAGDPDLAGVEAQHRLPRPMEPAWVEWAATERVARPLTPAPAGEVTIGLVDSAVPPGAAAEGLLLDPVSIAASAFTPSAEGMPTHGAAVLAALLEGLSAGLGEGAATGVRILPVDVYGDALDTTTFQVAEGVMQAMERGATVINLSLGSDQPSGVLREVLLLGHAAGVVFIASAGNQPVDTPTYPAAYPEVLAVTAVDDTGRIAPNVNYGAFVDVGAPGTIRFTQGGSWYAFSGTSMSAGVISGLVAALAERDGITPAAAAELVRQRLAVTAE
jgi:hypothetical protein